MANAPKERKEINEPEETPSKIGGEFSSEEEALTDEETDDISRLDELEAERNKNRRANLHALKVRRAIEDYIDDKRATKNWDDIENYPEDEK